MIGQPEPNASVIKTSSRIAFGGIVDLSDVGVTWIPSMSNVVNYRDVYWRNNRGDYALSWMTSGMVRTISNLPKVAFGSAAFGT
jgi:hypothetical protein